MGLLKNIFLLIRLNPKEIKKAKNEQFFLQKNSTWKILKFKLSSLIILSILLALSAQAQQKFPTLIRSSLDDEVVTLSADKPVYFPGDLVQITVRRNDSAATIVDVTPILIIEDTKLKFIGNNTYSALIPLVCTPGIYRVRLGILDTKGRRFIYETDCTVDVEEIQVIERISNFVHIEPNAGGENIESAVTLDRNEIRKLRVIFERDSIHLGRGPQFITIRTTVQLRDGTKTQTFERRILTFRSYNDPGRDRAMLIQYRRAYGIYAAIRPEEFDQVWIHLDSLPNWAIVKISIEPDYTIKIGGYDRTNFYTRYFRIKGPTIEMGFSLGIPKVLYDSQKGDSLAYGNSSAMLRFYYVSELSGNRFPVNLGFGTFGENSPIDVNVGRGGFALSAFLDLSEMTRMIGINLGEKITAGIEFVPFFPVQKKMRFLIAAQVGISF